MWVKGEIWSYEGRRDGDLNKSPIGAVDETALSFIGATPGEVSFHDGRHSCAAAGIDVA